MTPPPACEAYFYSGAYPDHRLSGIAALFIGGAYCVARRWSGYSAKVGGGVNLI
ncbi:MAG: hypothetical protein KAJ48_02035 [Elusimicrobiales bacterium]|nr:hypothetical protein [Elusimicrobiales bacterium]